MRQIMLGLLISLFCGAVSAQYQAQWQNQYQGQYQNQNLNYGQPKQQGQTYFGPTNTYQGYQAPKQQTCKTIEKRTFGGTVYYETVCY